MRKQNKKQTNKKDRKLGKAWEWAYTHEQWNQECAGDCLILYVQIATCHSAYTNIYIYIYIYMYIYIFFFFDVRGFLYIHNLTSVLPTGMHSKSMQHIKLKEIK